VSLTGWALPSLLALVALALFVVIVAGRPRRGGVAGILGRATAAVSMCAAVVATCAVVLNDHYLFFVTWTDVLDNGSSASTTVSRGALPAVADTLPPAVTVAPATAVLAPLPAPGQQWQTYTVKGARTGLVGQVLVYLPKGYDPNSGVRYPVIEALHGWPGGPTAVNHELNLDTTFQSLVDAHRVAPPIVVMPQINIPLTLDTECVNAPTGQGPQTMSWLGQDIPTWIGTHFRVADRRTSWLVLGASYGGWCAANVGLHYPATFGGAVSFLGYNSPEFAPAYVPFKSDPAGLKTYQLVSVAGHHPPPIALWLMASKEDHSAYAALVALLKAARPPLSVTAHVLHHGGHNVATIPPTEAAMVSWLVKTLPGFAPHA